MTLMGDAAALNDEERQLVRAAMSRLRDNKAERSNGAHTVVTLADESGVPRQRLYEHHSDLLNEFKATVGCGPVLPNVEALQRQLAQARDRNQELASENAQLRSKIRTLSAVITELTHETSRANVVVSMPRKHPGR
jgi:chromosome segregation ATPase